MKITTVGIDLAKNVFQIHAVNEHGKTVLKKQLKRDQVAEFFVNLPPCLASRKLTMIPGIGPVTASALIATIGDAKNFDNGRQMAAWLGLVPKQNSSGGKNVLLGISKRGDTYLRTLLIHGARAVIYAAQRNKDKVQSTDCSGDQDVMAKQVRP
jgi:transposase